MRAIVQQVAAGYVIHTASQRESQIRNANPPNRIAVAPVAISQPTQQGRGLVGALETGREGIASRPGMGLGQPDQRRDQPRQRGSALLQAQSIRLGGAARQ